jgi:pyrimidine operon attenuation protein/uracil phosphoribosyltransferase
MMFYVFYVFLQILHQSSDTKIQFNIHTLNKEMVDKIHSQNNIFLIGITHRSILFLSKRILIRFRRLHIQMQNKLQVFIEMR